MTDIETSLHPTILLIGVVLSIVFFVLLLLKHTADHSVLSRVSLFILRSILCLLVWFLIAQPQMVKTKEEVYPVTANLAIDVSQSMSLKDKAGPNTSSWKTHADLSVLDEALTLTEGAKIRLNLLGRYHSGSDRKLKAELESVLKILHRANLKLESFKSDSSIDRIMKVCLRKIKSAETLLDEVILDGSINNIDHTSKLISQAAHSIRRLMTERRSAKASLEPTQRIELVNNWLNSSQKFFGKLSKRYDLRVSTFSDELTKHDLSKPLKLNTSEFSTTHLYESLNIIGKRDFTKGKQFSMLVTDGFDSSDLKRNFSNDVLNQPLLIFPIGDPAIYPDSYISSVSSPTVVRINDILTINVQVSSIDCAPEKVTLTLKKGEEVLESKKVVLKGDGKIKKFSFDWRTTATGMQKLDLELSPVAKDSLLKNNSHTIKCQVIKNKYKVLVSDVLPRWETRYLKNLFNRDPSIEMSSIVFQPNISFPGEAEKPSLAFPSDLEALKLMDLIILGDLTPEYCNLEQQKLLVEYVNTGGNLILLAGPDGMPSRFIDGPLGVLIPMVKVSDSTVHGSFVVHPPLNESLHSMMEINGKQSTQVWRSAFQVTPQHALAPWLKAKESAITLLSATDQEKGVSYDFAAMQRYGSGSVAYFAASCLYHLRSYHGDKYHTKLWGQLIRGICMNRYGFEDKLVSTKLDRYSWKLGEEIQGVVRVKEFSKDPAVNKNFIVTLSRDGKVINEMKPIPVTEQPGDYYIRFNDVFSGSYELGYSGKEIEPYLATDKKIHPEQEATILIVEEREKSQEVQRQRKPAKFWEEVNSLPLAAVINQETLPLMVELLNIQPEKQTRTFKQPIWNTWWLLSAIIACALFEWILRRLLGLS